MASAFDHNHLSPLCAREMFVTEFEECTGGAQFCNNYYIQCINTIS